MSLVRDSEQAHQLFESLSMQLNESRILDSIIGRYLCHLKEKNLFKKAIGDMAWRDFLKQPEIALSEREADYLMSINKLDESGVDVIQLPTATIKFLVKKLKGEFTEEQVEQILNDAHYLTTKDLKERYHAIKTNDAPKTYSFVVMKRCNETGNLSKEHSVKSEEIKSTFGDKLSC